MKNKNIIYSIMIMFFCLSTYADVASLVNELRNKAFLAEDQGDIKKAMEFYKEIVRLQPHNFASMTAIAALYGLQENWDEEIIWSKKSIAINPNYDISYINYGSALASLGRYDEARKIFIKGQKISAKPELFYYSLGVLAEMENNLLQALMYYEKALAIDPSFIKAQYNIGIVYANQKKYYEAIMTFGKVIDLQPDAEIAQDARQMIKEITGIIINSK